jgi:segregation and condensation protein A
MLGRKLDWTMLEQFLPDSPTPLARRAATASTLLAGLELARDGQLRLRQDQPFGPIMMAGPSSVVNEHG